MFESWCGRSISCSGGPAPSDVTAPRSRRRAFRVLYAEERRANGNADRGDEESRTSCAACSYQDRFEWAPKVSRMMRDRLARN